MFIFFAVNPNSLGVLKYSASTTICPYHRYIKMDDGSRDVTPLKHCSTSGRGATTYNPASKSVSRINLSNKKTLPLPGK